MALTPENLRNLLTPAEEFRQDLHSLDSKKHQSQISAEIDSSFQSISNSKKKRKKDQEELNRNRRPSTAPNSTSRKKDEEDKTMKKLTREFLKRPNPHKKMLVKESTTALYTQLVFKERKIKQLEQKLRETRLKTGFKPATGKEFALYNNEAKSRERNNSNNNNNDNRIYELEDDLKVLIQNVLASKTEGQAKTCLQKCVQALKTMHRAIEKLKREQAEVKSFKNQTSKSQRESRSKEKRLTSLTEESNYLRHYVLQLEEKLLEKDRKIAERERKVQQLLGRQGQLRDALIQVSHAVEVDQKDQRRTPGSSNDVVHCQVGEPDQDTPKQRNRSESKPKLSPIKPVTMVPAETAYRKAFVTLSKDYALATKKLTSTKEKLKETEKFLADANKKIKLVGAKAKEVKKSSSEKHGEEGDDANAEGKAERSQPRRRSTVMGNMLLHPAQRSQSQIVKMQSRLPSKRNLHDMAEFSSILKSSETEEEWLTKESISQIQRANRKMEQLRLLLEAIKHLYLSGQFDLEKMNKTFNAKDAQAYQSALMLSEEHLMHTASRYGSRCCSAQTFKLYIYDRDRECLWTKSRNCTITVDVAKQLESMSREDQNGAEHYTESDVVAFAFHNRETVHISDESNMRSGISNNNNNNKKEDECKNVLVLPVFGSLHEKSENEAESIIGVLVASDKVEKRIGKKGIKMMLPSVFTELDETIMAILADHIGHILQGVFAERARLLKRRYDLAVSNLSYIPCDLTLRNGPTLFIEKFQETCRQLVFGKEARAFLIDIRNPELQMWTINDVHSKNQGRKAFTEYNDEDPILFHKIVSSANIASTCILEEKVIVSNDVYKHPCFNGNVDLRAEAYRGGALICVPLTLQKESCPFVYRWACETGNNALLEVWENQKAITLGCLEISFNISTSSAGKETSVVDEAGVAVSNLSSLVAPAIDHMWQIRLANDPIFQDSEKTVDQKRIEVGSQSKRIAFLEQDNLRKKKTIQALQEKLQKSNAV